MSAVLTRRNAVRHRGHYTSTQGVALQPEINLSIAALDLDPQRAAIAAGYSRTMAASKAYQWVTNSKVKPHVFAAVQKAMDKRAAKLELTADRVLWELSLMGYANMQDYIQIENGDVYVDLSKLTRDQATAIEEIVVDRHIYRGRRGRNGNGDEIRRTRFKLIDKTRALELLGKHLKLFTDVHRHTGNISLAERMKRADEEAGDE